MGAGVTEQPVGDVVRQCGEVIHLASRAHALEQQVTLRAGGCRRLRNYQRVVFDEREVIATPFGRGAARTRRETATPW